MDKQELLVSEIQQGRTELIEQLWLELRGLIAWYAKKYYTMLSVAGPVPGGAEFEDFVQSGYFGVLDAIQHYDPKQGATFTTFLLWYLRKAFQDCIGRTKRRWNDPLNWCKSLDAPDDDGITLLDHISDTVSDGKDNYSGIEEKIFIEQLHVALENALVRLPEKEAKALRGEYFEGKSQIEIASEIGCSFQSISSIKKSALQHIRYSSSRRKLEAFVDQRTDFYMGNQKIHATENKMLYREEIRKQYEREEWK